MLGGALLSSRAADCWWEFVFFERVHFFSQVFSEPFVYRIEVGFFAAVMGRVLAVGQGDLCREP